MNITNSINIKMDPSQSKQIIEGWGTSLIWFANVIGGWSNTNREAIADLLFCPKSGIGLNIVRYNIGGGENPDHKHMRAGATIPGFLSAEQQWNWDEDMNQRWMLQAAKHRGADYFEAFSNSPPYWMTKSNCTAGTIDGATGNLKEEYYEAFANYLTEVIKQASEQWGIVFQTLNPLNEPIARWWKEGNRQEGCHFDHKQQSLIIHEVQRKLVEKGLTQTRISAPDETSIDDTLESFAAYDDETKSLVYQINTHSYEGTKRTELKELAEKHDKRLWMSEYGNSGNVPHNHDDMVPALQLSAQILKDMKELECSAWVYWQAVEDEVNALAESGNWGLLHADLTGVTENYHMTKKYYAMANYSKFFKLGFRILDTGHSDVLAAYSEIKKEIVILIHNSSLIEKAYRVDLTSFHHISQTAVLYRTSKNENLEQLSPARIEDQFLTIAVLSQSITTYVISA
jgi:O-glycosyl hydrolase